MPAPLIRIMVRGAFAVTSRERGEATPRGRKTRGVLALLALAPDHRRERAWISEHLWSDRGPAQAAGSLRQALSEIRSAWGPEARALRGDGASWVALDPALVAVDRSGEGALLEGLGIHDRRFGDWLARQRAADGAGGPADSAARPGALVPAASASPSPAASPTAPDPTRVTIRCAPPRDGTSAATLGSIVAHQVAEGIAEQIGARRLAGEAGGLAIDLDVRCDVVETDGESLAHVCVTHAPTGEVIFSRRVRADGPAAMLIANDGLHRTAHEAAETTVGRLPQALGLDRPVLKAAALGRLALLRMFTYDAPAMAEAERLLAQARETSPSAVLDAWQGFLQMALWIDLGQAGQSGSEARREAAEAFMRRAGQAAGGNAAVHALVGYTRIMILGDAGGALPDAERAAEMSPTSPMALVSLASARLLTGRPEEAYALSRRARSYAGRSRFRHFFDNHHCVVTMATGRLDEAVEAAESAAEAMPTHAQAHRHLLALYAARGDLEAAERMRRTLERIDPGFDLDRMLRDPDYPVRTLRRTGLLEAAGRIG